MPFPRTKEIRTERREKAEVVNAKRAERTPAQQLAHLDKKFGKGLGAKRERARLTATFETTKVVPAEKAK